MIEYFIKGSSIEEKSKVLTKQPGLHLTNYILEALASRGILSTEDCCTYTIADSAGGTGETNLSLINRTGTTMTVASDTGTDAILPLADNTLAGLLSPGEHMKLGLITVTNPVDLDMLVDKVLDLITLSGVAANAVDLGMFSGTIIPDASTIKGALQALETALSSLGGITLYEYSAGTNVRVQATAIGITSTWTAGEFVITIPPGCTLLSCHIVMTDGSKVNTGNDGSGSTNWIRIKIVGTVGYNTSVGTMKIPVIQKAFHALGNPSLTNAYTVDIDNNPSVSVTDVSSNSITLRIINLSIPNGATFSITGI